VRVSDSMIHELSVRGLRARKADHFEAQQVASTGVRVQKPSDDPIAAARARGTRSAERRQDAIAQMSGEAIDSLHGVSDTLGHAADVASRVRELAVLGANDHLSADDRAGMAEEVSALRGELLALANTRVDGEHVFGGLAHDTPPFDAMGAYLGDTRVKEIEIGPGLRVPTQVPGDAIFGADAGGVPAFATFDALEAALRGDDPDAAHALLDDLDAVVSQIALGQARVGGRQQALQQAQRAAERTRDDAIGRRAELVEASPVEAFTELVRAENALREAISVASRLPGPSLVGSGG